MQSANFGASHYATVVPSRFVTGLDGTIVANVGRYCGFRTVSAAFHEHDNEVKYYYNSKQDFISDKDAKTDIYPSLNKMKEDYGEWSVSDVIKDDVWTQWI